jgi:predicted TIM-barrel fold metal-dependent hydrolase
VVIDAHLHLWNTERLRYDWLLRPPVGEGWRCSSGAASRST